MEFTVRFAVVAVLFMVAASAGAQTLQQFDNVVDIKTTLESLSKDAANQSISTNGKLVILNGVAESIQNLSTDPKQFYAMIELVGGKWHGLQSVSLYRCYVLVQGAQFAPQILLHPQNNPPANAVGANSQLMVVGDVKGIVAAPDGTNVPVVQALYIRKLD